MRKSNEQIFIERLQKMKKISDINKICNDIYEGENIRPFEKIKIYSFNKKIERDIDYLPYIKALEVAIKLRENLETNGYLIKTRSEYNKLQDYVTMLHMLKIEQLSKEIEKLIRGEDSVFLNKE